MSKYRVLVNPEKSAKIREDSNIFYLLSVDVARLSCQTVVSVFKVFPKPNGLTASLVNMFVLGLTEVEKHFSRQAIALKKLIERYNPREVVIDANGLGIGLMDFMVQENQDYDGTVYPAYGSHNDPDYKKTQPRGISCPIYTIKANGTLNSLIHNNCYARITSGKVRFLIKETEARSRLFATEKGRKMKLKERTERLMPYELTTKLFEEMGNLRAKHSGAVTTLEQINTRFGKDKFSSFEYGLWRIKEIEDEMLRKNRRRSTMGKKRKMFFYT